MVFLYAHTITNFFHTIVFIHQYFRSRIQFVVSVRYGSSDAYIQAWPERMDRMVLHVARNCKEVPEGTKWCGRNVNQLNWCSTRFWRALNSTHSFQGKLKPRIRRGLKEMLQCCVLVAKQRYYAITRVYWKTQVIVLNLVLLLCSPQYLFWFSFSINYFESVCVLFEIVTEKTKNCIQRAISTNTP